MIIKDLFKKDRRGSVWHGTETSMEMITFSEELIPQIVRITRMGCVAALIRADKKGDREDRELVKRAAVALEEQCVSLMEYWDRMQSED